MDGLRVAEADLTVYIHPSNSNKVRLAVLRQLSSLLFTYNENFDGIILAYEVHFQNKHAKILPGLIPYFGVKLKANLLLFSPKPDMLLEGKVAKLGKEYINVIVLGFSSATIMLEDIREEFKYKTKHGAGVFASTSNKRHVIKVGTMIRFLVKSLDEELIHIAGSLIPHSTGCIRWLSKHDTEDGIHVDRSLKRHRERDIKNEMQEHDPEFFSEGGQARSFGRSHKSRRATAEK